MQMLMVEILLEVELKDFILIKENSNLDDLNVLQNVSAFPSKILVQPSIFSWVWREMQNENFYENNFWFQKWN